MLNFAFCISFVSMLINKKNSNYNDCFLAFNCPADGVALFNFSHYVLIFVGIFSQVQK